MDDLRVYVERLEKALSKKESFNTYNKDISHAAAIVSAVFRHGEKEILLLSHKLDTALYGNQLLEGHIDRFLGKGGTSLRILVETDVAKDHPILRLVSESKRASAVIKKVPDSLVGKYHFNFIVMDQIGYRFERNRDEYAAVASFYEGDERANVQALIAVFEKLESASSEVAVT